MTPTPPLSTAVADLTKSIATNHDAMIILTQSYPAEAVIRVVDAHTKREVAAALARSAAPAPAAGDGFALPFSREDWGVIFDGVMLEIERSEKRKQANAESNSDARAEQGRAILAAIRKASAAPASDIAAAPGDDQAALDAQLRTEVATMYQLLDAGEWAEHIAASPHGQCLEAAITRLVGKANSNAAPGSATAGAAAGLSKIDRAMWSLQEFYQHEATALQVIGECRALLKLDAPAEVSPPDGAMPEQRTAVLEEAAVEAEHWQWMNKPGHRDAEAIAAAIRARKAADPLAAQPAEGSAQVASVRYSQEFLTLLDKLSRQKAVGTYEAVFTELINFIDKRAAPERSDTPAGLEKALRELMSIVRIHSDATAENFAWAEMQYAEEVLATPTAASQALDAAPTGPQWFSVDERLPEELAKVAILYWPYNNRENAQIVGWAEYVEGTFYTHEGDEHHPPSHWMNLPELPRIDGDKQGAPDAGGE